MAIAEFIARHAALQMSMQGILFYTLEVIESDSDDDDECDNDDLPLLVKSDYALEQVPRFKSRQFKSHFRLYRWQFEYLILELQAFWQVSYPNDTTDDMTKAMLMAIWYMANRESMRLLLISYYNLNLYQDTFSTTIFRGIGDRFGCAKSTVKYSLHHFVDSLIRANVERKYIEWPSTIGARRTANFYLSRYGLPGVLGHIDGTHIPIRAPSVHPNLYVNRKGFHSLQMLAVCDDQLKFLFVYTGEVGSKRVLDKSGLITAITQGMYHFTFNFNTYLTHNLFLRNKGMPRRYAHLGGHGISLEPIYDGSLQGHPPTDCCGIKLQHHSFEV